MGNVPLDSRSIGRGGWVGMDKGKQRGRGGGPIGGSNGGLDPLNEQNRGPRTIRTRSQRTIPGVVRHTRGQGASSSGNGDVASPFANKEQYNKAEFVTNYEHAKFFVIKSYSEDDVHKSIKYNVWASTPVGNKRLDAAYQEASTKCSGDGKSCPVFLFFSVSSRSELNGEALPGPALFEVLCCWGDGRFFRVAVCDRVGSMVCRRNYGSGVGRVGILCIACEKSSGPYSGRAFLGRT